MHPSAASVRLALLSSILAIGTASTANAAPIITVQFSGEGTGSFSGPFSGVFRYDQAHVGSAGTFDFNGSAKVHAVSYTAGSLMSNGSQNTCEPFVITTTGNGGKILQLIATAPSTRKVSIILPTSAVIFMSPGNVALPACGSIPNPPLAGSTFRLSAGATVLFEGKISSITCTP